MKLSLILCLVIFPCLLFSEEVTFFFSKPDYLTPAMVVIQNKCFTCHSGPWKNYKTSQQWVDSGLVKPSDFRGSQIIYSLRNFGGDMPMNPKFIVSNSELRILKRWINSIN